VKAKRAGKHKNTQLKGESESEGRRQAQERSERQESGVLPRYVRIRQQENSAEEALTQGRSKTHGTVLSKRRTGTWSHTH
jgi:hypothetical protein